MAGAKWIPGAVLPLLWAGLVWGQQPGTRLASADQGAARSITVQARGGQKVRCQVLQAWVEPDGATGYVAQALDTGEKITVIKRTVGGGQPGQGRSVQKVELYFWGAGNNPPRGAPRPPATRPQTLRAAVVTPSEPGMPATGRCKVVKQGTPAVEFATDGMMGEVRQVAAFEPAGKPASVLLERGQLGTSLQLPVGTGARTEVEVKELGHEVDEATAAQNAVIQAALQARHLAEQEAKAMGLLEMKLRAAQDAKEKAELEAKLRTAQEAKEKAEREAAQMAESVNRAKAALEASLKAEQEARVKAEQAAKAKAELEARVQTVQPANLGAAQEPTQSANADPLRWKDSQSLGE